jgi:hypothetical protein
MRKTLDMARRVKVTNPRRKKAKKARKASRGKRKSRAVVLIG